MDVYIDEELYYQSYPIEPNSTPGDIVWKDMKIKAERVLKMYKEGDKR